MDYTHFGPNLSQLGNTRSNEESQGSGSQLIIQKNIGLNRLERKAAAGVGLQSTSHCLVLPAQREKGDNSIMIMHFCN